MTHLLAITKTFLADYSRNGDLRLPLTFPRADSGRFALYVPAIGYTDDVIKAITEIVFRKIVGDTYAQTAVQIHATLDRFGDDLRNDLAKGGDVRLSKRVARVVKKGWQVNLDDAALDAIGNLDGAIKARTLYVDVTSVLEWNAGDFGDHKSCFFTCHSDHRTRIHPTMGTVALRFWDGLDANAKGTGRALIVPLAQGVAGYVYTNAYGATNTGVIDGFPTIGQRAAQAILMNASGVRWVMNPARHAYLGGTYVNPKPVLLTAHDAMGVDVSDDVNIYPSLPLPKWAKRTNSVSCDSCGDHHRRDDLTTVQNGNRLCEDCLSNSYTWCDDVGEYVYQDDVMYDPNDEPMHQDTWDDRCLACASCDSTIWQTAAIANRYSYTGENYARTVYGGDGHDYRICLTCLHRHTATAVDTGRTYVIQNRSQWHAYPPVATLTRSTLTGEYVLDPATLVDVILPDGTLANAPLATAQAHGHEIASGGYVLDVRGMGWTPYDSTLFDSLALLPYAEIETVF